MGAKPYEELLADLNASYGLDKPVLEGYFVWLKDAVRGDFGESWVWTQPVTQKFANVIWYSFAASAAFCFSVSVKTISRSSARRTMLFTWDSWDTT